MSINANHGADDAFEETPNLCIAPAVMSRMKIFSDEMAKYGESYSFSSDEAGTELDNLAGSPAEETFSIRREDDLDDLVGILFPQEDLHLPVHDQIKTWLLQVFQANRGFELGTFHASILATVMKKQSSKWGKISLGFVSDAVVIIHRFIHSALASICDHSKVREALAGKLSDELNNRYQNAISCAEFLLKVENSNTPLTLNHYFNDNLQRICQQKATAHVKNKAFVDRNYDMVVRLDDAVQPVRSMSNEQHVVQDIHDILESYYKVCRKTFVDSVCRQAVVHFLLESDEGPLALLSPVYVSQLSAGALEDIAGEDSALKQTRAQLTKEMASLAEAVKILARK